MIFWTIVKISFKSLLANKLRSLLAMLGIIIGVWSVISSLALAAGTTASITKQISAMGTNVVMVMPAQRKTAGVSNGTWANLRIPDALAMVKLPSVAGVAPVLRGGVQARYYNKNTQTSLLGTAPPYFEIRDFKVEHGRSINDDDVDAAARVAVVGSATGKALFGDDYVQGLGKSVQVNGVNYRIVGFLKSKGDQGWFNPDDQIIIPFSTAMSQVLGHLYFQEIDVSAKDESRLDQVEAEVTMLLRTRHRLGENTDNDFEVHNMADVLRMASTINTILSVLLGGIAAISLLVGGIGVMNIMLVTVAERTREIGIRKAIGAKRRDILRQFLIEAIVMSGLGGFIGVVAGILTALIVSASQTQVQLLVEPQSVFLALGFSAGVGMFFGYYPALRAARLDPIEALRYE